MIDEQKKWKITDKQVEASQQFEATFARFGTVIRWLTNIFVEHLQPALEDIMKAFIELVDQNREWLKTNIKDIATAVGQVLKAMAFIVKALALAFAFLVEVVGGGNLVWAATIGFISLVAVKLAYLTYLLIKVINIFRVAASVLSSPWQTISRAVVIAGQYISTFFSGIAGWIAKIGPTFMRFIGWIRDAAVFIAEYATFLAEGMAGTVVGAFMLIAAAALVVADAWNAFRGKGSYIDDFRKKFTGVAKVLDALIAPFTACAMTLKWMFNVITGFFSKDIDKSLREAFSMFYEDIGNVIDQFFAPFISMWESLKEFKDWFLDFFGSDTVKKSITIAQKLESDGVTDPNFAAGVAGASGESVSTERKYSYDNANSVKKHEYGGSVDFNVNITGDAKNLDKRELQANIQGYLSEKQTEAMRALNSQRRQ
jgi:hypothetical protein